MSWRQACQLGLPGKQSVTFHSNIVVLDFLIK
ncbi:unnamed protein product [Cylicostephanus goldi]|uniref:Uncharacterized protein n=1 Tax=Cylicostephanus goldi TaxID=71465 RepID=A0A3P7PM34_CYLGO|nr:unnamed protein product [Cylicostephanus goldi]